MCPAIQTGPAVYPDSPPPYTASHIEDIAGCHNPFEHEHNTECHRLDNHNGDDNGNQIDEKADTPTVETDSTPSLDTDTGSSTTDSAEEESDLSDELARLQLTHAALDEETVARVDRATSKVNRSPGSWSLPALYCGTPEPKVNTPTEGELSISSALFKGDTPTSSEILRVPQDHPYLTTAPQQASMSLFAWVNCGAKRRIYPHQVDNWYGIDHAFLSKAFKDGLSDEEFAIWEQRQKEWKWAALKRAGQRKLTESPVLEVLEDLKARHRSVSRDRAFKRKEKVWFYLDSPADEGITA
ncbi:hypothetical protein CI109_101221 [Kwoniella shandongensis]|uniref:Uncharacterized protein n=1 Tax=Kwoniella shandongensis TaxID=1734106 RepID=A0A5M6BTY3_9TREE|nr:uncharacterized protein CI109_005461 [Kwoniella shandongensis]KAA5526183.1 hypothetical protein CI109_005461 [Kwoniella shandongensis]